VQTAQSFWKDFERVKIKSCKMLFSWASALLSMTPLKETMLKGEMNVYRAAHFGLLCNGKNWK
jgi:hypothetical protein